MNPTNPTTLDFGQLHANDVGIKFRTGQKREDHGAGGGEKCYPFRIGGEHIAKIEEIRSRTRRQLPHRFQLMRSRGARRMQ